MEGRFFFAILIYMRFPDTIVWILQKGGVGVVPTDTVYGIVASALDKKAVQRVYVLRKRNPKKPMIILIAHEAQLGLFGVHPSVQERKMLRQVWPGRVSVILPCSQKFFTYLHRGTKTLAFRVPVSVSLRAFLKKTGPLIAPSANTEGRHPAETVSEAKKYFGTEADFYVSAQKRVNGNPSAVAELRNGAFIVLRTGPPFPFLGAV